MCEPIENVKHIFFVSANADNIAIVRVPEVGKRASSQSARVYR
jgi:hypothetical protein